MLREKLAGGGSPAEIVDAVRAAQAELLGKILPIGRRVTVRPL